VTIQDGASIGKTIRIWREAMDLSLNQLAESSGVSKGYLSQLENGVVARPSADALGRIAEALGKPLYELLGERRVAEEGGAKLPRGLEQMLESRSAKGRVIPPEDVEMLKSIRYRGRQPKTAEDWDFLYETIVRTIK
jgi:transcriptional regulator with XRE-family HTH domain